MTDTIYTGFGKNPTSGADTYQFDDNISIDGNVSGINFYGDASNMSGYTTIISSDTNVPSCGAVLDHVAEINLNKISATSYTLISSDKGKLVTLNNASSVTLTIPDNSAVSFPIGTQIELAQLGSGQVTVSSNTDTIWSVDSANKLTARYSTAVITKVSATAWLLAGDITT